MSKAPWPGLPYLDALRPEPGWHVDGAVLTTYSADMIALVAALLALAGLDDDRGSGSKVDFANAHDQLRDRVRLLLQAGRLSVPPKNISILSILDRYIVEMNFKEQEASWHPKIALIRLKHDDSQATTWRLWVGSRNLSRSLDWEAGLLLVGQASSSGQAIPGVAELGADLARRAGLNGFDPEGVKQDLARIVWQTPPGVSIDEIRLLTSLTPRGLPTPPAHIRKLWVISPFVDGTILHQLSRWGNDQTQRALLSTHSELARLHAQSTQPLKSFQQLLSLVAPAWPEDGPPLDEDQASILDRDVNEESESRGLHAKLIFAEHGLSGGGTLWLTSANATVRGWRGPNVEVVAQLTIEPAVAEGLLGFVEDAQLVDPASLATTGEPESENQRLETARQQVAARWRVTQHRHPSGPILKGQALPHPDDEEIRLEVGLLTCDLVTWPRRQQQVQLPPVQPAQETELVQIRLSLGSDQCTWLQHASLDPPPTEERDQQAMARYLDARTFLLWLRSLLGIDGLGDGGGEWHTSPSSRRQAVAMGPVWWAPTLEEVLRTWSRSPESLREIDRRVEQYLKLMQELPKRPETEKDDRLLAEFQRTWQVVRQALLTETS